MRPCISLAPHQAISQKHAQKSTICLSVLKLAVQTVLHPLLEGTLVSFRITILLKQLSPSGSGVLCAQPPFSSPGKHTLSYTVSWWKKERHTSQESVFSVSPSEKQKSTGVCKLLASLGHTGRRRVVLSYTLNTQTLTKTDEQKKGLCIIFMISATTDIQTSPHK